MANIFIARFSKWELIWIFTCWALWWTWCYVLEMHIKFLTRLDNQMWYCECNDHNLFSKQVLQRGTAALFEQCNVKERNQTRWQLPVFSTHAAMVTLSRKVGSTFPQSGLSMRLSHHLCTIAMWSISLVVQVSCTRHILLSSICHANLMLSYVESCWVCLWDSWQCGTCKTCCWACPGAITRS